MIHDHLFAGTNFGEVRNSEYREAVSALQPNVAEASTLGYVSITALRFHVHQAYVIVIGNGRKQSTKTARVIIPMMIRARPSGSICCGSGWRTRSMTASKMT